MSFKDLFFKPVDEPVKQAPKQSSYVPPQPTIPSMGQPTAQVDASSADEYNKYFRDVMDKANLPGPGYNEFAKALDSMQNMGLTEQQKFQAVFAGLAAQGMSTQKLIDTANQYVQLLTDKKASEFDASVTGAQKSIDAKKAQYTALLDKNTELSKQMQDNATQSQTILAEVTTLQAKLESKKTTFAMSFQNFISKIQGNIQSIQNYLNGNTTK